jgi:hypothetical protein
MPARSARTYYLAGLAVMLAVSFVQVWMTVVGGIAGEDNPQNQGFLGVVVTAAACAFVARGRAPAMARAMLATAGVQALLAAMLASAPITQEPGRIVVACGVFCMGWLASAGLFARSARQTMSSVT